MQWNGPSQGNPRVGTCFLKSSIAMSAWDGAGFWIIVCIIWVDATVVYGPLEGDAKHNIIHIHNNVMWDW